MTNQDHPSLILSLDQPSNANPPDPQSEDGVAEAPQEYSFTIEIDRIERSPPAFIQATDSFAAGKVLHGTLVPQNVFEKEKLRGRGKVSVTCPKSWNLRLWLWRKLGDGEKGAEVYCLGTLKDSNSRHQSIQTVATKISGCYPVLGYLGIMLVLSPIMAIIWPAMFFGKFFFPGLTVLLIVRGAMFFWPQMLPDFPQFDVFLLCFFLFGGTLKFYWWAITLGTDSDSDESDDDSTENG